MKTRTALTRFISCGLGILLALLLITSDMKAQSPPCPPSAPDDTSVHWTQGQCWDQNMSIDSGRTYCYYTICFCYRYISSVNTFDYTVSSVTKRDDTCGSAITSYNVGGVVTEALHFLVDRDPAYAVYYMHIPPCGSGAVLERRADKALCYEVDPPSGGNGGMAYPCASTGWCVTTDSTCMSGGNPITTGTNTSTFVGTCSCNVITCD